LCELLAQYATGGADKVEQFALELAARSITDTVGVALAGVRTPAVECLRAVVEPSTGACWSVDRQRCDPWRAAMINGAAAHALDFDDVDDALIGHPSAVLVPTVLAVGESIDASGARVCEAYWRGLTTMRALAAALDVRRHYALGWHSTSTLGVLGATVAACHLLLLEPLEVQHALGIAASRAAGSRQNFGTMTKCLHAGAAAADGVLAARAAAHGFTADPHQLDGPLGFAALYSGLGPAWSEESHRSAVAEAAAVLHATDHPAVNVKLYPCCYAADAAVDCALGIRADHGIDPARIADVRVRVPPRGLDPLIERIPLCGMEAKFSLPYVVALSLSDGQLTVDSFTDESVAREWVRRLAAAVVPLEDLPTASARPSGLDCRAQVVVRDVDGTEYTAECDTPLGHAQRPADAATLRQKFVSCAGDQLQLPEVVYDQLLDVWSLSSIREATDLLIGPAAGSNH
jgi:2-methylcitrate dehydratase PrpD